MKSNPITKHLNPNTSKTTHIPKPFLLNHIPLTNQLTTSTHNINSNMLMLFLSSALAITCPSYICSPSKLTLYKEQCIYASKSTYYLSPCSNSLIPYCTPSSLNSTCIKTPAINLKSSAWPGESCTKDSTCAYGMCYQSRCNAQNFAKSCNIDDECNPGLFCNLTTYTCQFLIQPSMSGCTKDTDCVNSAGCNFGTCIPYFSIKSGQSVESCENNQNMLCSNVTCGKVNENFVCGSGVKSFGGICQSDSNCVSSVDSTLGYSLYSQCRCSLGEVAKGYCTKLPGDSEYLDYIGSLKAWLNNDESKMCSSVRRFTDECLTIFGEGEEILKEKLFIELWPQIENNTECTMEIFNTKYWNLVENQVSYSS